VEEFAEFSSGIVAGNGHKRHKKSGTMSKNRFVIFVLFVVN